MAEAIKPQPGAANNVVPKNGMGMAFWIAGVPGSADMVKVEVPKAMADAFRTGNLGVMDYYKMKNIEADTSMREAIAKPTGTPSKPLKD